MILLGEVAELTSATEGHRSISGAKRPKAYGAETKKVRGTGALVSAPVLLSAPNPSRAALHSRTGRRDVVTSCLNKSCLLVKQLSIGYVRRAMQRRSNAPKGIKDLFYETRVLSGREYTVTRFAKEVLGGAVDPVMLGYIEKRKRFPNEALVRRLATVRNESVAPLLAVLYRDRMLYAFGRELRRALHDPTEVEGIADADLAVQVSRAIAALPDDGAWITTAKWRTQIGVAVRDKSKSSDVSRVTDLLKERGLVEQAKGKVRRKSRHFVATTLEERRALAMEFTAIYTKALLDKVSLPERAAATHLRNHYLHIERERLPEFYQKLEKAARALAEEFAADAGVGTEFLNVLIVGTPV